MAGSISGIDWVGRMPVSGTHTVTAGEANANAAVINTGKHDAVGFIFQVLRSKVDIGTDAKGSIAAGVLKIEDGSTYKLTAGDVINWIAF